MVSACVKGDLGRETLALQRQENTQLLEEAAETLERAELPADTPVMLIDGVSTEY